MNSPIEPLFIKYDAACDACIDVMVNMNLWLKSADINTIMQSDLKGPSWAALNCDDYGRQLRLALNRLSCIGAEFLNRLQVLVNEINEISTDEDGSGYKRLAAAQSESRRIKIVLVQMKNLSLKAIELLDNEMLPFLEKISQMNSSSRQ